MLELLLGRGQSYEDLSSLLGAPTDEIRSKARWALAELGGGDPDRNVGLTDYLLGQADPIGRADAVRHLRDDPADRELAERLVTALGEIAPGAELPRLPGEGRTAPHVRAPRREGTPAKPRAPRPPGDPRRARLLLALGCGAVVLLVVVLAIAGVFSGGDDSSTTTTSASTSTPSTGTTPPGGSTIQPLRLKSVGGGPGSGIATFGLATNDTPYLDIRISDLPAPANGQVYAAWLVLDAKNRQGYPLAPLDPYPSSGPYHDVFDIPSLALPLLQGLQAVEITTTPIRDLQKEIQKVISDPKNPKLVLPEIGDTVLRGVIPAGSGSGTSTGG